MKRLWQWLCDYVNRLLEDRYGLDGLSVLYLCIAIMLSGCAHNLPESKVQTVIYLTAFLLAAYAIYRCFSRNQSKQEKQFRNFRYTVEELDYKVSLHTGVWKIRRGYRNLRCRQCKHRYRVAKKRGKHTVTCPNCGRSRIIKH